MSTLTDARKAIAEALRAGLPRQANVAHYELGEQSPKPPQVSVEIPTIGYYRTTGGTCSKAEIEGRIVVQIAAGTAEDVSNMLDEYLDPYSATSVVSVLMAEAVKVPPFGGAVESFVVTESTRTDSGVAEIPFRFTTTRPAP